MSKHMGTHAFAHACFFGPSLDPCPKSLPGHGSSPAREKYIIRFPGAQQTLSSGAKIIRKHIFRCISYGNKPGLISLSVNNAKTRFKFNLVEFESNDLTYAHAGGVQKLEHRLVPHRLRCFAVRRQQNL